MFLFLAAIITFFYFFPVLNQRSLRQNGLLKPLVIGLVFSIVTTQIPMIENHYEWHEYIYSFTAILFFVTGLALIFDIGDVDIDENETIRTIPKMIGVFRTRIIITCLMGMAMVLMFYTAWTYLIDIPESVAFVLSCLAGIVGAWKASVNKHKFYYLLYIDGLMALPLLFSLIFYFI
jgi:4-hydroxybenzoate polyprenyltransferase